jgi:hypothetical protein
MDSILLLLFYVALFKIRIKYDSAVYRKLQLQSMKTCWQPPGCRLIVGHENIYWFLETELSRNENWLIWLRNNLLIIEPEITLLLLQA